MAYIEKPIPGEYFNPISSTVVINDTNIVDCDTSSTTKTDEEVNKERWQWLIDAWSTLSFKEKISLFAPYLHYVNTRDCKKEEFDDAFNIEIQNMSFKLCRTFAGFKFDPDMLGIPNLVMVFNPIDPDLIPDTDVRTSVQLWGKKYGFIKDSVIVTPSTTCTCCE